MGSVEEEVFANEAGFGEGVEEAGCASVVDVDVVVVVEVDVEVDVGDDDDVAGWRRCRACSLRWWWRQ